MCCVRARFDDWPGNSRCDNDRCDDCPVNDRCDGALLNIFLPLSPIAGSRRNDVCGLSDGCGDASFEGDTANDAAARARACDAPAPFERSGTLATLAADRRAPI